MPLAMPGDAVSPGINNCNLMNVAAFTVVAGLVLAALAMREPSQDA